MGEIVGYYVDMTKPEPGLHDTWYVLRPVRQGKHGPYCRRLTHETKFDKVFIRVRDLKWFAEDAGGRMYVTENDLRHIPMTDWTDLGGSVDDDLFTTSPGDVEDETSYRSCNTWLDDPADIRLRRLIDGEV